MKGEFMKISLQKRNLFVATLAVVGVLFSLEGLAAENVSVRERSATTERHDSKTAPHVAALGGFADTPRDNTNGLVGVDVGFQPVVPISLGASYSVAGPGSDDMRSMLLGHVDYNFGGTIPIIRYSYIGAAAGWVRDRTDFGGGLEAVDNYPGVGPQAGFDQPIADYWTVGAQARYLFDTENSSTHIFSLAGVVKYWL